MLARHVAGEEYTRWLARAGRCGGAAPAQGRAEGPTAQKIEERAVRSEERENFARLVQRRELTVAE